jgi:hypothetical protein
MCVHHTSYRRGLPGASSSHLAGDTQGRWMAEPQSTTAIRSNFCCNNRYVNWVRIPLSAAIYSKKRHAYFILILGGFDKYSFIIIILQRRFLEVIKLNNYYVDSYIIFKIM